MPSRPRSLLPALALAATVLGVAVPASLSDAAPEQRSAPPAPPVATAEPRTHELAVRRAPRRPSLGARAARIALGAVGVPYRWGGASPGTGFDCSGLVYWAYNRLGLELPHSSYALNGLGRRVPSSKLKPGDVLFFYGLGHVGLYVGRGRMVHAPQSGRYVEVVALRGSHYGRSLLGARRMVRT